MAVHNTRVSAARTQTNNNLKQIALACHACQDTYKKLPPVLSTLGGGTGSIQHTLHVHLLPFIESSPFYSQLATQPTLWQTTVFPPLLAPLDTSTNDPRGICNIAGNLRLFSDVGQRKNTSFTVADGIVTCNPLTADLLDNAVKFNGVPNLWNTMKLTTIADGTSNVIMFSTRYSICQSTQSQLDPVGEPVTALSINAAFFGAGTIANPASASAEDDTFTFQVAPSADNCRETLGVYGHSHRVSGLNVSMCDGSIRQISPKISPQIFQRAMLPNDGLPLDTDWEN